MQDKSVQATVEPAAGRLILEREVLRSAFDREAFGFSHTLSGLDLFSELSIERLAAAMSRAPRDYFVSGNAPTPGAEFYSVPNGGVTPATAFKLMDRTACRILLKRPENHDPRFRELLHELFGQVVEALGGLGARRVERLEAGIFISSRHTVTPIHFDPEMSFFLQIAGAKVYTLYPPNSPPEPDLERFYIRGRNDIGQIDLKSLDPATARVFQLGPGRGVHQPQNAPHWVETGDTPSISYTFLFQTDASRASGRTRALNYCMRRIGLRPSLPRLHPERDAAKAAVMQAAVPLQLAGKIWNKAIRVVGGRRLQQASAPSQVDSEDRRSS